MRIFEPLHIPPLDGATEWLNTAPLDPAGLHGHVVLVDFGTFTCINWLRHVPYVRAWSQAYHDDGLVVIAVHTPEFSFEHSVDSVRRELSKRTIDFPVAVDNDYTIWSAFANNFWPALYFIDAEGVIRDFHYGEGRYDTSERVLQKLLGVDRDLTSVSGSGVEAPAEWHSLRSTETYLGYGRGERFASPGGVAHDMPFAYRVPDRLRSDHWAIDGEWTVNREQIVLEQPGGRIAFRVHARDAHLVLSTRAHAPIPFRVLIDGEAPGTSHGGDVDEQGNGVLEEGRLYQLVRQHGPVHKRLLEVVFLESGAEAYAFTFG